MRRLLIIIVAALLSFLCFKLVPAELPVREGVALLILIAILWLTEALPLAITALLVPLVAVALGVFPVSTALSYFAHPIIFLFLGGFAIATALTNQQLDKKLVSYLVPLARNSFFMMSVLLSALTAVISMWISNTAATLMILPMALGLLKEIDGFQSNNANFLLLGIAYSASIGGIATLVGSPANAVTAAIAQLDFAAWLKYGLLTTAILWPFLMAILFIFFKPDNKKIANINLVHEAITVKQIMTILIFFGMVVCWIFGSKLATYLNIKDGVDALIAMIGLVTLVVCRCISWSDIETKTNWGVLILFGGGLCLGAAIDKTGAATFLANELMLIFGNLSDYFLLGLIMLFIIFMTEFMSNTACAAVVVPIFMGISEHLHFAPVYFAVMVGIATNCGFMLPVATPPNALVYATKQIPQKNMIKAGFCLNIACAAILVVLAKWLYPML